MNNMNETIILYYDLNDCSNFREFKDYDDLNQYLKTVYYSLFDLHACDSLFKITKIRVIKERALFIGLYLFA